MKKAVFYIFSVYVTVFNNYIRIMLWMDKILKKLMSE